jgi:hypothetical protein
MSILISDFALIVNEQTVDVGATVAGAFDGARVVGDVGTFVGTAVGALDGAKVGVDVGDFVGTAGALVGNPAIGDGVVTF